MIPLRHVRRAELALELPWKPPEGVDSIYKSDGPPERMDFTLGGIRLRVVPTHLSGVHTGRRRYEVDCLTCGVVVHPATTGASGWCCLHVFDHETGELEGQKFMKLGGDGG